MPVLVLAELDQGHVAPATARLVSAAQTLGDIHLLLAGASATAAASEARFEGVTRILVAEGPDELPAADSLRALLAALALGYSHVIAAASSLGRDVIPGLAAKLGVMPVTDIVAIVATDRFERPIYAGNAFEHIQSNEPKHILTIRPSAFAAAKPGGNAEVEMLPPLAPSRIRTLRAERTEADFPDLSSARIVVSGGVSLGSKEKFALVEDFARTIGGAVGATRAAVDAGYAPNDWQVGQTGKVVAPDLYIGIGVSGALQHLAGMQGAKRIIAINKDAEAPLVKIADLSYVGDLFEALPALISALKKP